MGAQALKLIKILTKVGFILPLLVPSDLIAQELSAPLDGPHSPYTDWTIKAATHWPPPWLSFAKIEGTPVQLELIETQGNEFYIGVQQLMWVNASLESVEAVLDNFKGYQEIFPDLDDVHVVSRAGNTFVTFWEQHIPVFFVPNVKFEMNYVVEKSNPDRTIYRYQLKKGEHIKKNDGLIVIERDKAPDGKALTRYSEFDFYDADWGPLKTFAPGRIWKDSVEGIYVSDLAVKLKAENPTWPNKKVKEESAKLMEKNPIDAVLKVRKKAP